MSGSPRLAQLPKPPYTAVIFSSQRTDAAHDEYEAMADEMVRLAALQPGFLGIESARDESGFGITTSYWSTTDDAKAWKAVGEHLEAQRLGRQDWYRSYEVRIAVVERAYGNR